MLTNYFFQRSIAGTSSATQLTPALDISFIVKKFKNYSTDEYSTIDSDGMSVPPLACAFSKMFQWQHVVGIVDEDGYLVLYNTHKTGKASVIKTWQVHANAVFDLEWLQEENKILTASGDQKIILHDIETCAKLEVFKGHNSSVKSISCRSRDDAVFATGSHDGHIMMWDKRISSRDGAIPPVLTISNAHVLQQNTGIPKIRKKTSKCVQQQNAQQSVTAVLFQNDTYVISAGAVDGCLKVWDIRKNYKTKQPKPVHTFHYPGNNSRKHGYSSLVQVSNGLRLFANCTDDAIYEYDMAAYKSTPVRTWRGHKNSTFYVKSALSPDDQFLLSGSSDELAYIWQIDKPHIAPVVLKSHTAEVTSVAWCPNDLTKLVTLSDDTKAKFWRVCCRELEKKFHPQWFGKAERISKDRATSTYYDAPVPKSTPLSPSVQKLDLQKPKSNLTSSPTCIIDWLKRKSQSSCDDSVNHGLPSCKIARIESTESETTKLLTSTNYCRSKKRTHEESEDKFSDCPVNKSPPCVKCTSQRENNGTISVSHTKKFKSEPGDLIISAETGNFLEDIKTKLSYSPRKDSLSKTEDLSVKISVKCISPCKSLSTKSDENNPWLSPDKSLKRKGSVEESPISSPKRPCLTHLNSNGASSHVKVSLFSDSPKHSDSNDNCAVLRTDALDQCLKNSTVDDNMNKPALEANVEEQLTDSSGCSSNFTPLKEKFMSKHGDYVDSDSPTRDLPNLVIDQLFGQTVTPPRIQSKKCHSPKLDWLTLLRLQKAKNESENSPKRTPLGKTAIRRSLRETKRT